jgi:AraC-like DNA-binding protein
MSQISATPIREILFAARFERTRAGMAYAATSLPGHLLHLVVGGAVRQECNGREYVLRRGDVMWYHEDELVRGTVLHAPWTFYSVNFIAPTLPPPAFEARVFHRRLSLRLLFAELLAVWQDESLPPLIRQYRAHAALLRILATLTTSEQQPVAMDPRARLWWELETKLRQDLRQPVSLTQLAKWAGTSPATVARSCQFAVGAPPLRRIKQVRLSLARGLVLRSALTMKEIAERIGYPRGHEFSRDYRKAFGKPPTSERG